MKWTDIKEGMLWVQQQKSGNKLAIDTTVSLECLGMSPEDVIKKCYSVYGGCDNLIASSFRKEITTTTVSEELVKAGKPPQLTGETTRRVMVLNSF
ncbi:hypothetical protein [Morganella morganii]|uniref:hypothetical protein n=1 Tax=Morganella morganii TaxID=582 RepID=UPI00222E9932|nr:hypothetical protein [Morganella morganii]MDM8751607.1 hypothetical protein [Morganella morganii]HEI9870813.1 hypothetical protein [Morganella morganii]